MAELTDEARTFLRELRYAVLATPDPDGTIRLTPIWYLFDEDRFYFATSAGNAAVRNAERSGSASVVVDSRVPGRERWLSGSGPVDILRDGDAAAMNARIWRRYLTPAALRGPIAAALAEADDATIRLSPTEWRSWVAPNVESPETSFLATEV